MASDTEHTRYRFDGTKNEGEKVDRIVLEGSSTDPTRWIDLNGEAELSPEEVESLRERGYKLHKTSSTSVDEPQGSGETGESKPDENQGESGGEAPAVSTQADQQRTQAQGAAGTPAEGTSATEHSVSTDKPKRR